VAFIFLPLKSWAFQALAPDLCSSTRQAGNVPGKAMRWPGVRILAET
jgi:hypothetical protein